MANNARIDIVARTVSVGQAERQLRNIDRTAGSINQRLGTFRNVVNTAFAATAVVGFATALGRVADNSTNVRNRIRLVTGEGERLNTVYADIRDVAIETRTELNATARTFSRIAIASREAGVSLEESVQITRTLNQALIVSGATVEETSSALLQFSQAFASGVLQGEELRALRESAPLVAEAFARELGGSIEDLKEFARQGLITRDVMRRALRNMRSDVERDFMAIDLTISQSLTNLRTQFTDYVGNVDRASGSSRGLAEAIELIGENIGGVVTAVAPLVTAFGAAGALRILGVASGPAVGIGFAATGAGVVALSELGDNALEETLRNTLERAENFDDLTPEGQVRLADRISAQLEEARNRGFASPPGANPLRLISAINPNSAERRDLFNDLQAVSTDTAVVRQRILATRGAAAIFDTPAGGRRLPEGAFGGAPRGDIRSPVERALADAQTQLATSQLSERDQFIVSRSGLDSFQELNDLIALGDQNAIRLRDTLGQVFDAERARELNMEAMELAEAANDIYRSAELEAEFKEQTRGLSGAELQIATLRLQLKQQELPIDEERLMALERILMRNEQFNDQLQLSQEYARGIGSTLENSLVRAFETGEFSLRSFGRQLLNTIARTTITNFIGNPFQNFLRGQFSGLGGGQFGGTFTIPGSGAPDSALFAARVTPGETVTLTPPGEQFGGNAGRGQPDGGITVILPESIRNMDDLDEAAREVGRTVNNITGMGRR